MRQLICMSADGYCQKLYNWHMQKCHIYNRTERRGTRRQRGRERVCVRERVWLKIELASVVTMVFRERLTILGKSRIIN